MTPILNKPSCFIKILELRPARRCLTAARTGICRLILFEAAYAAHTSADGRPMLRIRPATHVLWARRIGDADRRAASAYAAGIADAPK